MVVEEPGEILFPHLESCVLAVVPACDFRKREAGLGEPDQTRIFAGTSCHRVSCYEAAKLPACRRLSRYGPEKISHAGCASIPPASAPRCRAPAIPSSDVLFDDKPNRQPGRSSPSP